MAGAMMSNGQNRVTSAAFPPRKLERLWLRSFYNLKQPGTYLRDTMVARLDAPENMAADEDDAADYIKRYAFESVEALEKAIIEGMRSGLSIKAIHQQFAKKVGLEINDDIDDD